MLQTEPMRADEVAQEVAQLVRVNLDDLVDAFGARGWPSIEPLLRRLGARAAGSFARKVLGVDALVGRAGLRAGACRGLEIFGTRLEVCGQEAVPHAGPRLFLANHPGMTDTLALFAAIPGDELRVLAARRPFLELLPHFSAHLIWVDEGGSLNRRAIREAVAHLRAGGTLLTFPAGRIEPDPAVFADAALRLAEWNASIDLFARLVPETAVVPTLVSGVIAARAARSPLRVLRRDRTGKDHLSALLQLSLPALHQTAACVTFGTPRPGHELLRDAGPSPATAAVVAAMRALMDAPKDSPPGQCVRHKQEWNL